MIKNQRQPKNIKIILHSRKTQHKKLPNARITDENYDIIIERKSYTFKNPKRKFWINKDWRCNSKNIVYVAKCNKCKQIYIGLTQTPNTRISLRKSNIKIPENRKLNVSKQLYECNLGKFKTMPIYQTKDYTLLQIKEKDIVDKIKLMLNK